MSWHVYGRGLDAYQKKTLKLNVWGRGSTHSLFYHFISGTFTKNSVFLFKNTVFIHVCVHVCMTECVHMSSGIWRPEEDAGSFGAGAMSVCGT